MHKLKERLARNEEKLDQFIDAVNRGIGITMAGASTSNGLHETNNALKRGLNLIKGRIKKIKSIYKRNN